MNQNFRHPQIVDLARREGRVTVDGLAAHFGVTLQTIRRDLSDLAEAGHLERVHGGAVLPSGTVNIAYEERRALNAQAKAAMAAACARRVPDDCAVFLNIGTSTEAVARALLAHRNLLVVTNNINVANILLANDSCDVVVTGGSLRARDGGLVGALAADTIRQFRFDIAIVGCSALDPAGDLLDFDIREVGVSQTILDLARKRFLVADHSKLERSAPVRIASLSQIDAVFTDAPFPGALASACGPWETEIVVAD